MIDIINKLANNPPKKDEYRVEEILESLNYFVGIDSEKNICFFIKSKKDPNKDYNPSSRRLTYIDIIFDNQFELKLSSKFIKEDYTLIKLKTDNSLYIDIFLSFCQDLIKSEGDPPLFENIIDRTDALMKIFSKKKSKPTKTEIGLWGELFLISKSKDKDLAIKSWHINNNDQFDFIDGKSIIEVKTTTNNLRVHSFRHEQIISLIQYEGILCSLKTKITNGGMSVGDLTKENSTKIEIETRLIFWEKLLDCTDNPEDFTNKFDTNIADISLSFYDSSKLPHIKSEDIPNGVEKVKYEINIENLEKTNKHNTLSSNVLDSQNSP